MNHQTRLLTWLITKLFRLVVYQLFDRLGIADGTPAKRGKPMQLSDAVEVAAATARHLFEQHYDGSQSGGHHRSQSGSERDRERREERERERMMRSQPYAGVPGYGQQFPPSMSSGYYPGSHYGHQGHHGHYGHGGLYSRGYERGEYDSDDEGEGWDRSRMRPRSEGFPGGGGMCECKERIPFLSLITESLRLTQTDPPMVLRASVE